MGKGTFSKPHLLKSFKYTIDSLTYLIENVFVHFLWKLVIEVVKKLCVILLNSRMWLHSPCSLYTYLLLNKSQKHRLHNKDVGAKLIIKWLIYAIYGEHSFFRLVTKRLRFAWNLKVNLSRPFANSGNLLYENIRTDIHTIASYDEERTKKEGKSCEQVNATQQMRFTLRIAGQLPFIVDTNIVNEPSFVMNFNCSPVDEWPGHYTGNRSLGK